MEENGTRERNTGIDMRASPDELREELVMLLPRLRRLYGKVRWRRRRSDPAERRPHPIAELHWYEAHGIGKKEFKRKRYLD